MNRILISSLILHYKRYRNKHRGKQKDNIDYFVYCVDGLTLMVLLLLTLVPILPVKDWTH